MAKIRRIDFSPDEWIAGTLGLTLAEEGLLMRACALIYSHGGPITVELLKKSCFHDHGNRLNACLRRLVELGKLMRNGDEIDSKRCRFELEKARKRIENAKEKGLKGGRPNGLAKPAGFSDEKLTINYQLSTSKDTSEAGASDGAAPASPDAAPSPPPPLQANHVQELWDRGTAMLGPQQSARNLIGKLRREHGDVAVLDGLAATEAACPSNPVAYLVACLREKGNGHGHKLSARENLWLGFAQAAGDRSPDCTPAAALLDRH